ncbi:M13 family metallopeptidase [Butyrivibrio sp. AE2032]|uniref:M13 family metallopeptidase n=1 Tax=Butyrivibrio sp. AE2032 TaxID=1458463 RepID=UPI0005536EDF|nr:M13 family metallopeptidase [Butyrivibrio sp. AE2032]
MNTIPKKLVSLFVTGALCLSFASCSASEKTGKDAWIASDLLDNQALVGNTRLQDDYASAVNADWIMNHTYDPKGPNGSSDDSKLNVDIQKRALLDDTSKTSKNLELARAYDGLFSDWDYRDSLGVEPLRKYLNFIDDIKTLDDAKSYMLDNSKNPFAVSLVSLSASKNDGADDHECLNIKQPEYSLGSPTEYYSISDKGLQERDRTKSTVNYLMERLGYTDKQANTLLKECFAFETKLADINPQEIKYEDYELVITKDEVLGRAGNYPLNDMFDHYGLGGALRYHADLDYLSGLDSVFTEKNLEGIKAYFKVRLMVNSLCLLDEETFTFYREMQVDRMNPFGEISEGRQDRYLFHVLGECSLNGAMEQAYLDEYFDEEVYQDLSNISEMLLDEYREIINSKDWLSDENKARLNEKLDNMVVLIMKPSNTADYGDMTLLTKTEGGTLLDAYSKINEFGISHLADVTEREFDRAYWDIYSTDNPTTSIGSAYAPWLNILFINIGILAGSNIYSKDMTLEQKLGSIGMIIGHEMTHAFDSRGVNYDSEGNYKPIIEGDDMSTFNLMSDKVTAYYAGYTPFEGSGSYQFDNTLSGEAIADMGSIRCALNIAKQIDGFDYDQFFRSFATMWRNMDTKGDIVWRIREDDHPLAYLRINVTVQQFDEFYETYGVKPGDNMYLAPEDRIAIW